MESGPTTHRPNAALAGLTGYMRRQKKDYALITTLDGQLLGIVLWHDLEKTS